MKKSTPYIAAIIVLIICYLFSSFIKCDFNISHWSEKSRVLTALFSSAISLITFGIIMSIKNEI